jgi:hypothetical protein
MAIGKVDLKLLKKLVGELESSLATADGLKDGSDASEYVVEMSKCAGLASGVMSESVALIGDIQVLIQKASGLSPKEDPLSKILGIVKGGGGGLTGTN